MPDTHTTNRLIHETSPYLLQHAHNPVDWRPWGPEAFAEAQRLDKPLLVSIGYSTCHWCHVMERESFENAEVAEALNQAFVCLKVDREERPDVDDLYMTACQLMTGRGGWPLNVLLTPEGKPFFAATYLPPEAMANLAEQAAKAWRDDRRALLGAAEQLLEHVARLAPQPAPGLPAPALLDAAAQDLAARYDAEHGGFSPAPKFPSPHQLLFLLRQAKRSGRTDLTGMVAHTLRAMARGGLFDHLGGGFHRYSTDERWLLPHFEKMLYDQAMLALAYVEGFQATGEQAFADTARAVLDYVLRDLAEDSANPGAGGFHAAEDADSEGHEGRFYVWTEDQVRAVLGERADDADNFLDAYGFAPGGNFADEATGKRDGTNIPHLPEPLGQEQMQNLAQDRAALLAVRETRIRPHKDDKVLTDWNGLMIAALARAGRVLDEPRYQEAAARAADFLLETHQDAADAGAGLLHVSRHGRAHTPGFLDDYAFLAWGLTELAEAGPDAGTAKRRLDQALVLAAQMVARFQDEESGALYLTQDGEAQAQETQEQATGPDGPPLRRPGDLPLRRMEATDGALPSGVSAAVFVLSRLFLLTGDAGPAEAASRAVKALGGQLTEHPSAFAFLLCRLGPLLEPGSEQNGLLTLAGPDATAVAGLRKAVDAGYHPGIALAYAAAENVEARLCRAGACQPPVSSPESLAQLLA